MRKAAKRYVPVVGVSFITIKSSQWNKKSCSREPCRRKRSAAGFFVSRETLQVPVLALGVPTVVDAAAFSDDEAAKGMFVTPRDIDASVRTMSKLLGYAINIALHNGLTVADIDMLKG